MELEIPKIAAWALLLPEWLYVHHPDFVPAFPGQRLLSHAIVANSSYRFLCRHVNTCMQIC